jgi:hypothetical protein
MLADRYHLQSMDTHTHTHTHVHTCVYKGVEAMWHVVSHV